MLIIKVDATDSTNLHLKRLMAETVLDDLTVLAADVQHSGRGQAGSKWLSEPGKNMTISVLKHHKELGAGNGFQISMAVSLALIQLFQTLEIPDVAIKWPNDIMSGNKKICGILIENTVKGNHLSHSVIGIGINVNQDSFAGLPQAASLKQLTGKTYDLDALLDLLLKALEKELGELGTPAIGELHSRYEESLFLKGEKSRFVIDGEKDTATVRGVTAEGKLVLERENGEQQTCRLKQVVYLLKA